MNIIISSHIDTVRQDIPFNIDNGKMSGLLDNYVGNYVSLQILNNPSILKLHESGKIKFYFGTGEEFGLPIDYKVNPKEDLVIAVDVCCNKRYNKVDVGIEQIYKIPDINGALEGLKWEGHKIFSANYKGDSSEADECDQWHDLKVPHLSFIIPILALNDNWHGPATITIEKIKKATLILERLICYLS